MVDLFESDNSATLLQINATNAFNSLNGNVFLHNVKVYCPEISNFVISCNHVLITFVCQRERRTTITRRDHTRRFCCNGSVHIAYNTINDSS